MPEFVNYQLQQIPIRQIDTNLVGNTLATITAGNKEALQKQSELRTAIANMDLNEAEDGFRQQLFDDITTTIENNSVAGNAYYALDDIIKKAGDIGSNPGLLGRLKAQQEYKKFSETLDARVLKGDINQDTADWAKAQNPYHYQDKIDKVTGKVIGGTEWKPDITPVKDIDFNDVFDAIAKELKPESNSWSGDSSFLYKDGTSGNNFKPGETVGVLSSSSGQYIRLTQKAITDAIQNAFQNNPELAAQAKQSWDVLKWKAKEGKITPNDNVSEYNSTGGIFNNDGSTKSYEQYLTDMVDGYARTHQYNNRASSTKYHDAAIARQYDILSQSGRYKQGSRRGTSDIEAIFGNPAKNGYFEAKASDYINDYNNSSELSYNFIQSSLKSKLADLGFDIKEDITSIDQIKNLINSTNNVYTTKQQTDINNFIEGAEVILERYRGDIENMQNTHSKESSISLGYNEVLNALNAGISLNSINTQNPAAIESIQEYSKLVDRTFGDKNLVGFRFKSKAALDKFVNSKGGEDALITQGHTISGNNIYIDKDHSQLLYGLVTSAENYNGDYWRADEVPINSFNDFTGSLIWHGAQSYGGAGTVNTMQNKETWTRNGFDNMIRRFGSQLSDKATKANTAETELQESERLWLPQYRISSWSSFENELANQNAQIESIFGTKEKKEFDTAAQQAYIDVKNGQHQDENIRVFNNDGRAVIVDTPTKLKILEELQAIPDKDGRGYAAIVDGLGARYAIEYSSKQTLTNDQIEALKNEGAQIIITDPTDNTKNECIVKRNLILDYYENDDRLAYWNSLPVVQNSRRPVGKYFANSNYYYGGRKGAEYSATPYKTEDIDHQWRVNIGGSDTNVLLNNSEAQMFENVFDNIIDKRLFLKSKLSEVKDKANIPTVIDNYAAALAGELYSEFSVVGTIFPSEDRFIDYVKAVLGY